MGYFNDAGEPLMTAAAARLEAELDAMSAMDGPDDYPDYPDYDEEEGDEAAFGYVDQYGNWFESLPE